MMRTANTLVMNTRWNTRDDQVMPPPVASAPPPRRPAPAKKRAVWSEESEVPASLTNEAIHQELTELIENARGDRLECAVPLLESLQISLTVEHAARKAFPGTLTVAGWMSLLNRWEALLKNSQKRQIFFAKSFFHEARNREEEQGSPLAPVLRELLVMMEQELEV